MNSLSISGEEQVGDPTSAWGMSESWDPPVATAICTAALADSRHYHGGHGQLGSIRQDWEWPAPETGHSLILPPAHYSTDDQEEIDCKPAIMQVEALGGGAVTAGHLTSRHYNGILTTSLPSSIAAAQAAASTWPNMFNAAAAIRHHNGASNIGLDISSPHATYVASSYGNLGPSSSNHAAATGPGSYGGSSSLSNYFGINDPCARLALVAEQHRPNLLDLGSGNDEHRRIHDILRRSLYSSTSATDFNARIGLNLGGRTYFSTEDVMNSTFMAARFGRRFRPNSPGAHVPLCQAEGCKADLGTAKHYHRRHKVCEQHSKAATVLINGQTQRFCQQCSRFHALSEFDEGKRSCRKRLADHNRRRRKPQPTPPTASSPGSHAASGSASTPASSAADNGRNSDGSKAEKANSNEEAAKAASVPNKDQASMQKQDASASSSQKPSSLLSAISLVPSVSLTLQNDSRENVHSKSSEDTDQKEAGVASGSYQPSYLLNGPSLTLSSLAESQAQPSAQNTNFAEVDLPWLTAARALDNSSRMDLIDSVGRSASTMAATGNDHHHAAFDNDTKTADWNVTPNLADNGTDGRTVLSLLEGTTAARAGASNHNNRLIEHEMITQNQLTNRTPSSSSNSLGFLQDHLHPCPNSRTTHLVQSQDDHVLSMQQRMSNMYTTADFMKDGFL